MLKIYIIDADNCLSVEADLTLDPNVQTAEGTFTTQEDLATMTKDWAASRLVEVWNSFAGAPPFADLKEVKRFTDRKSAVARIWNAAERLGAQVEKEEAAIASKPAPAAKPKKAGSKPTAAKGAPAKAKATKGAKLRDTPAGIREGSKTAQVVAMLQRNAGRDHGQDGLAAAYGARIRGRRDEEGRIHRRVLQTGRRRADLPHQRVASSARLARARPDAGLAGVKE
jgi:hypothetical protein